MSPFLGKGDGGRAVGAGLPTDGSPQDKRARPARAEPPRARVSRPRARRTAARICGGNGLALYSFRFAAEGPRRLTTIPAFGRVVLGLQGDELAGGGVSRPGDAARPSVHRALLHTKLGHRWLTSTTDTPRWRWRGSMPEALTSARALRPPLGIVAHWTPERPRPARPSCGDRAPSCRLKPFGVGHAGEEPRSIWSRAGHDSSRRRLSICSLAPADGEDARRRRAAASQKLVGGAWGGPSYARGRARGSPARIASPWSCQLVLRPPDAVGQRRRGTSPARPAGPSVLDPQGLSSAASKSPLTAGPAMAGAREVPVGCSARISCQ
jgi:hypothetical protein